MKAYEYIIAKQTQWALNQGISLIGSKGERGRPVHTTQLDDNLFQPLALDTRCSFEQGDGSEIRGSPSKMQALHSSAALSVNTFQYWQNIKQASMVAAACGFCRKGNTISERIVFEDKYPVDDDLNKFPIAPNIDVVFHNAEHSSFKRFAVECKFSEAYRPRMHGGLKRAYMDLGELWSDIPNLQSFAQSICPTETFIHLQSAQLIKHILGLQKKFGKEGFKLLYLWYDVLGKEGSLHRAEISEFSRIARADNIYFEAMSYQELILIMFKYYRQEHSEYIKYMTDRYL